MKGSFLAGDNVYLRPIEMDDAGRCRNWINDAEVRRYLLVHRPCNEVKERKWIESRYENENELVLAIAVKKDDSHIGNTGLHSIDYKNRKAELGIVIGSERHRGKGFGTESAALIIEYAFNTLNLNRVYLRVFDFNERARRSYEKLGFAKEGVWRQDHFVDGRYCDTVLMGLLRSEWTFPPGK